MTDSSVPRAARLLGLAGLLPSLAMVVAMLALPEARGAAAAAGVAYGALIASFIGGTWWGLAAARAEAAQPRLLALSVAPALFAWPAMLLEPMAGLTMLAIVFAVLVPTDRRLQHEGVAPAWWLALRRPLSFGMAALHAVAATILALSGSPPTG
jgi:hypothetical protein